MSSEDDKIVTLNGNAPSADDEEGEERNKSRPARTRRQSPSAGSRKRVKDKQVIKFKDAVGRKIVIPFAVAKTWQVCQVTFSLPLFDQQ